MEPKGAKAIPEVLKGKVFDSKDKRTKCNITVILSATHNSCRLAYLHTCILYICMYDTETHFGTLTIFWMELRRLVSDMHWKMPINQRW